MTEESLLLWGKTSANGLVHPLICHMIDTAQVALALWELSFPARQRESLAREMGVHASDAGRALAYLAGLHDIGKAGPAFQCRFDDARGKLAAAGFPFASARLYTPELHGLVTAWALESMLAVDGPAQGIPMPVVRAIAGHHGVWPDDLTLERPSRNANLGGPVWDQARQSLAASLAALLGVEGVRLVETTGERNAFLVTLSGLVSSIDWVASMEDRFPCAGYDVDLAKYWEGSGTTARQAVRELGWAGWQPDGSTLDFGNVFPFPPNTLQLEVLAAATAVALPALAIVESPTGGGKSEAAFALADRWLQRAGGRGIYFAMPTQATSNQMFGRVRRDYLERRYPDQMINIQLAHGQASLSSDFSKMILRQPDQTPDSGTAAYSWFLPRKRTLLAPFAVGTVDQSFLAVLQAKHFFVRLYGLANKVVVFDEVHAYDAYMNEVLCLLLRWLRVLGTSVILLSATLSAGARARLIRSYAGAYKEPGPEARYPRLSLVSGGQATSVPLSAGAGRTVTLETVDAEPSAIVEWLHGRLAGGGNAVVVCNTVRRAQEVFAAVRLAGLCPESQCKMFHARFPFYRRRRLEGDVTQLYGKGAAYPAGPNPARPVCSILVATQVIEQSLDLDFDVMVSDLAPMDLLVQRAGRLHRHSNHPRPKALREATLAVCSPSEQDGDEAVDFGGSQNVYEPYLLLRTWVELLHRKGMSLPAETDALIQAVYGDDEIACDPSLASQLLTAKERRDKHAGEAVREALARLIPSPDSEELLNMANVELADDENPAVHRDLSALTRLGPPGVPLVCLHRKDTETSVLTTLPDGRGRPIDPAAVASRGTVRRLLFCVVSVAAPQLEDSLRSLPGPAAWSKSPALRYHRLAVFIDGICRLPDSPWTLYLDETLGLSYGKEVQ